MPTTPVTEPRHLAPERTASLSSTADHRIVPPARRRLEPALRNDDRFVAWVVTIGIGMFAGFLRLWHLGRPNQFLFDETYYAKDAWSLWHHGFVTTYVEKADKQILAGKVDGLFTDTPSLVVHPEVGKWLIALGEHFFGMNSLGWRVSAAVAGTIMVMVMIRLVRRMTGSTLLGGTAGLLLCVDGLHLVLSRSALLDIFQALFLVCALACMVADRDWGRARLARLVPEDWRATAADWGPVRALLWRPWLLAAGVFFGLSCAVKWSSVYPLAAFGLVVWLWNAGARRAVGIRNARRRSFLVDGFPAFFYLVVVALLVYVLSWTGWLLHAGEYERALSDTQYGAYWGSYVETDAQGFVGEALQSLRSLWNFHQDVFTFHRSFLNEATHTYQSKPQWWLVLNRPVGMQAELGIQPGVDGCTAPADSTCLRQILLLGNPALWWGGVLALIYSFYGWIGRRDWRFGLVVVGLVSTWLPWVRDDTRPIFSYYSINILPFTVIAVTLLLGVLIGDAQASRRRRLWGTVAAGAYVVLVLVNFAWFWPIWTGELISTPDWLRRIWFRQWI